MAIESFGCKSKIIPLGFLCFRILLSLFTMLCLFPGSIFIDTYSKSAIVLYAEAKRFTDDRLLLEANKDLKQDMEVLLRFSSTLKNINRHSIYQNWKEDHVSPCNWSGVTCGKVNGSERVTALELGSAQLEGDLSRFHDFPNLTALSILDLGNNSFNGQVPGDLGKCKMLKVLNLSSNLFEGFLNLRNLSNLQILDISSNRLNGSIASILPDTCPNLISVNISNNNFTGTVSEAFSKCERLRTVDVCENHLDGPVWPGFSNMQAASLCCNHFSGHIPEGLFADSCKLQQLDLSENELTGTIPTNIHNCRDLSILDLASNNLNGSIPSELGMLSKLQSLFLHNNSFLRDIPQEITKCTNLTTLDLSENKFGGNIQPIFGELKRLRVLVLHHNFYGPEIPSGIFNLSSLLSLDLSYNNFSGPLPTELMHMHSLQFLDLAGNKFSGNISGEIGELNNIQVLDLSSNSLSGQIPPSIGNLTSMLWLTLANNNLTGRIPEELGKCKSLLWLNLANNQLSGPVPAALSSMGSNPYGTFENNRKYLVPIPKQRGTCLPLRRWLPADYPPYSFVTQILNRRTCNQFWHGLLTGKAIFPLCQTGNVSKNVTPGYLQFSGNRLQGPLPASLGEMHFLSILIISLNNIDGEFPEEISNLPLYSLNVSHNDFNGTLPYSLCNMHCLQYLDFSFNNFRGQIPNSYANLTELVRFNISYNPFITGPVPTGGQFSTFDETSYTGDPSVCFERPPDMIYNITSSRSCNIRSNGSSTVTNTNQNPKNLAKKIVLALSIFVCGSLVLCGAFIFLTRKYSRTSSFRRTEYLSEISDTPHSPSIKSIHFFRCKQFTFTDILLATSNFSDSHVIGMGGFGSVYKGKLKDGSTVAVKKFLQKGPQAEKEFLAEMETLGKNGFHENLVPLLGCCLFGIEKILVYEFISNGSLEHWLHEKPEGALHLDWPKRLKIAIGTARALKFLHHDCSPGVIHRDMKGSNILLDKSFNPFVSDFGLARLLNLEETHVSTVIAGTLGYVPPEYSHTWRATTKGDVYSFGVVLLELATGRRPLFESDNRADNLVEWVGMLISCGQAADALDPILFEQDGKDVCALSTASSSIISCSSSSSSDIAADCAANAAIVNFLHLGHACTQESPDRRPNMDVVLRLLESLSRG